MAADNPRTGCDDFRRLTFGRTVRNAVYLRWDRLGKKEFDRYERGVDVYLKVRQRMTATCEAAAVRMDKL
jgi:hypothetical protein